MEITIITKSLTYKDEIFIDAIPIDTDLLEWGNKWIESNDEFYDIEFWNNGSIHIHEYEFGKFLIFKGDNGRIELNVITKNI